MPSLEEFGDYLAAQLRIKELREKNPHLNYYGSIQRQKEGYKMSWLLIITRNSDDILNEDKRDTL